MPGVGGACLDFLDWAGRYVYMDDLRGLDACRPVGAQAVPAELQRIATPLHHGQWSVELRQHPDQEFASFLLRGLEQGFRIGFNYSAHRCGRTRRNMLSARQHPEPIESYLAKEIRMGRIMGPLDLPNVDIHISRFGVIPKPHQPGKWRLITDLSSPRGGSVNDGIDTGLCSLSYTSVDDAVRRIIRLGRGARLAKFDIESAYRLIPVHPEDRRLLGMSWNGKIFVDGALPFGLRSAPKLFTALADALSWVIHQHGVREAIHYLDDYLLFGAPGTEECEVALRTSLQLCEQLGVPIASHKVDGPATSLVFLGIELDTLAGVVRLPPEKLLRLRTLIIQWKERKSCNKRELLSLIGQLQHACRVVRPGRTFLRRMIDLSTVAKELHHHIRLNAAFRSDLQWWALFLEGWNGVSLLASVVAHAPSVTLTTDASGSWGCGAFISTGQWFQFPWPEVWKEVHITVKELLPIVVACAVWGHLWRGTAVCCRCDNMAVVAIIRAGSSKHPLAMHLMRCLFFFTAYHQLYLAPEHLPGRLNTAADSLSRNDRTLFLQLLPEASPSPTPLPDVLLRALVLQRPDWTADSWTSVLRSTLRRV